MLYDACKDARQYKKLADERAQSLRVADRGLFSLVAERRQCEQEVAQYEQKLQETGAALTMCAENTTKKVYLEQVKRNCTIANNRLIRLAKK